jgi:SAM-dependent methyltransferase
MSRNANSKLINHRIDAVELIQGLYQGLLDRKPDPSGLEHHLTTLRSGSLSSVIKEFTQSEEFQELTADRPFGFNLNLGGRNDVQIDLSKDEIDKLWAHIRRVWTQFGAEEPYWSVLTGSEYKSDAINHPSILETFYNSSASDISYLDAFLKRNDVHLPSDSTVAEFGCGVGRVTGALARRFSRVLAFDVSATHLAVARERMKLDGIDNVDFVLLEGPSELHKMNGIDFFFSFIVLQHNPPPIVAEILEHALAGLNPDGVAFFQVPTYGLDYHFNVEDYYRGEYARSDMEIHFIPQKDIFRMFTKYGFQLLEVRNDHYIGNYPSWISNTFLAKRQGSS